MCWSETTSIVTFLLGSILNVFAYMYLTYKKSPSNILVFYWQFTLLMQIPEAITWNYINNDIDVYGPSRIAMILNVFQPIALFLCVINGINNAYKYILIMQNITLLVNPSSQLRKRIEKRKRKFLK